MTSKTSIARTRVTRAKQTRGKQTRAKKAAAAQTRAANRKPRIVLRLDFDETRYIGHGRIELLELIAEHGSIAQAARRMGMSYRRAWLLVESINQSFKTPAVESQHGGSGGGKAQLTPLGRRVVETYRAMQRETESTLAASFKSLLRDVAK